jgi:hypothetical protein
MFKNKQGAAFDSYDPSLGNSFDPSMNNATGSDSGTVAVQAKAGQKMQLNVILSNPTAKELTFELFNYLNSYLNVLNTTYVNGTYKYIPLLSYEGLAATNPGTHGGTIGFDQNGVLKILGDTAAAEASAQITCKEFPYQGLFTASGITPFNVSFLRFTCQTDPQIDETITWFKKTFSGGEQRNPISPRAYFKPNQFQNFTIDITVSFSVRIDEGLRTVVLPGESVRLAFFIMMWVDQSLAPDTN